MRAGELNQLVSSDFHFDADVPYFSLTRDEDGKTLKNAASVRAIPIAPVLLVLGLREFVERRQKTYPGDRIFREFPLGTQGRKGGGLTAFWGRYVRKIGLYKPGRATHVNRHTVVDRLREAMVAEEDIAALLGHSGSGGQTRKYGSPDYPLERKAATVGKIEFGFDVVEAVGGPFDKHRHGI